MRALLLRRYYISCWYPADRTTVPYTVIETGITVSQVVAAPIAAGLLLLDGKLGLRGWQWLFMVEGMRCRVCAHVSAAVCWS
jgi:hypothetical protein